MRANQIVPALIRSDNPLYKVVADNIHLVEMNEADSFDAAQNIHHLNQAALLPWGKIDLRDIARHHHLRVEANTRQHHLHLFRRGVLRLVDNDKAVVQRTSAHEGDRSDFDGPAFQKLLHLLHVDHVIERIVEGAQIRIDFFL